MTAMNKSTSEVVSGESPVLARLASRLDVGRRVLVSDRFAGTLKYVGRIVGKEGVFCGVELDDPIGKHDGTHRNVNYFECRPYHGIFAPTYKVQLAEASNSELDASVSPRRPPTNVLTHSAIPALSPTAGRTMSVRNNTVSAAPSNAVSTSFDLWDMSHLTHDPMNWSLISGGSSMLSSGSAANALGLCDDLMMNSNHTYVVTDSDYLMLNEIEISDSNLLHLDDSEEDDYNNNHIAKKLVGLNPGDSVVLERPTMDSRLLPRIGSSSSKKEELDDEEEAATPLVEDGQRRLPGVADALLPSNHYSETLSVTAARHDNSCGPSTGSSSLSASPTHEPVIAAGPTGDEPAEKSGVKPKTPDTSSASRTASATRKSQTAAKTKATVTTDETPKRDRPPKKPRVSLKEMIQQTTAPVVPRPPKPPSKSQLMMERIKASIEADKARPKKPATSRFAQPPTDAPPTKDSAIVIVESDDTATKPVGEDVEQENMVVIPTKTTPTFGCSASGLSGKSTTTAPCSNNLPAGQRARPIGALTNQRMAPRASGATPVAANRLASGAAVPTAARAPLKTRQMQQPTAHGIAAPNFNDNKPSRPPSDILVPPNRAPVKKIASGRPISGVQLTIKTQPSAQRGCLELAVRRQLAWNAKAVDVLSTVSRWELQEAERRHVRQLERMRVDFAKEVSEKCDELRAKLENAKQSCGDFAEQLAHSQNVQTALEGRFEDERAALTLRAEEAENALEKALIAKCELEKTMAKDDNEKIQKLSNDISGLNFVIQQKTDEVRKLRADNFQLQSEVDGLRQAKIEVQKLQNRLDEAREQLKRQQNIQKDLVQQLERCREEAQNSMTLSKITEQENEVLKYKMQHLNEFTPHVANGAYDEDEERNMSFHSSSKSLHCLTPISSRTVNNGALRTPERHNSGGTRPNSTSMISHLPSGYRTPPRTNGNGSLGLMHKSLDAAGMSALSVFQSQGRSGRAIKNTPSKIYAPEGTFEVSDQDLPESNEWTDDEFTENLNDTDATKTPSNGDVPVQNGAFIDFDAAAESVA